MKALYVVLIAVLLVSCGPSAEEMTATSEVAQAQTQTAVPTLTPSPTLTPTATPIVSEGLIVFDANRNDNYDIYLMNADGSGVTQLTSDLADDFMPAWSPQGDKIAFASDRSGNLDIYLMNFDGSNPVPLTDSEDPDIFPAFSPDGTQLAFVNNSSENGYSINIFNIDDGSLRQLVKVGGSINLLSSGWSPDGLKIVYGAKSSDNYDIFIQDVDGTGSMQLTDDPANDQRPAWSPDGSQIAFTSDRDGDLEVYVMNSDGSNTTRLTAREGLDGTAIWSPDGTKLAYESRSDNNVEIFSIDIVTKESVRLTDSLARDGNPAWSTIFIAALPVPLVIATPSPTELIPCRFVEVIPVESATVPSYNFKAEGFIPFSRVNVQLIAGRSTSADFMSANSRGMVEGNMTWSIFGTGISLPKNLELVIDVNENCSIQQEFNLALAQSTILV